MQRDQVQLAFEDAAAMLARARQALALAAPDDLRRRAELIALQAEAPCTPRSSSWCAGSRRRSPCTRGSGSPSSRSSGSIAAGSEERDEAEAFGDPGRLARATAQIEALTAELERAFGLGGRERRVGAASERARTNVQRRIAHALDQIRAASPRLGEHLAATIKTGHDCCYDVRG